MWAGSGAARANKKPKTRAKRKSLFDAEGGDIALVGDIFKLLGTPDESSWPVRGVAPYLCLPTFGTDGNIMAIQEASNLPDFPKITFDPHAPVDLTTVLPNLPANNAEGPLGLLKGFLVVSASSRRSAKDSLALEWFKQDLVLPEKCGGDANKWKELIKPWLDVAVEQQR
jgi:hypothetical protein